MNTGDIVPADRWWVELSYDGVNHVFVLALLNFRVQLDLPK
jgi:hypothetical protein